MTWGVASGAVIAGQVKEGEEGGEKDPGVGGPVIRHNTRHRLQQHTHRCVK